MKENRETIIFDSSGLTALMNETDAFHHQALSMSEILTDSCIVASGFASRNLCRDRDRFE
jgi:hypothetical protein